MTYSYIFGMANENSESLSVEQYNNLLKLEEKSIRIDPFWCNEIRENRQSHTNHKFFQEIFANRVPIK